MEGIDLNSPIEYRHSSLRFFAEGERHSTRLCRDDVLLLVYEGVLRFMEDGVSYELRPGEYHIQKQNTRQDGPVPSDSPRYLYVHFLARWKEAGEGVLPRSGVFDCGALRPVIEKMDTLAHSSAPYIAKAGTLYEILTLLQRAEPRATAAAKIAAHMEREYARPFRLDAFCGAYHFSRNHIISLFKKEYGVTPVVYLNRLRIRKAEHLMEVTSESLERIAVSCGFPSYSHFYRQFAKFHGCAPDAWRTRRRMG